eukprot:TRINITY_DN177_c0_g2_i1.p2 TRINITY_DN177_c0_g2~~TRINITY_DN177_c0_g2_i1.p2  ORF type:complete len:974 (+),score=573.42 TRINITY_DN177_c0_g2_i1:348-2924(+)
MLKFMRFGDDEDSLNAKDALLLWIQNKTATYSNLKVENFKRSFKDGLVLCALIHKHRPKLIDYDSLKPGDSSNIQVAFDAAEKYFQLEQYLTTEEYQQLDENSMVVYAAEYYHGIAEQRKVDLAVRRVHKLIKLTEENDEMRAKHNEGALRLKDHMAKVEKLLSDRTIDNTMAGAKKRIADFYEYKQKDKRVILADQLSLEALFNNLAMRLAHHKRPAYVPPEGCKLSDVEAAVAHLEECEQERNVALHAELNRQIKLVRWNDQHTATHQKIKQWVEQKDAYVQRKEQVESVGVAQYQLSVLDSFYNERTQLIATSIAHWKAQGDSLAAEKYENIEAVRVRENEVDADMKRLLEGADKKKPVLEDDLAREQWRESLRLQNKEHQETFDQVQEWVKVREAFLKAREEIDTISLAQMHIKLLEAYEKENAEKQRNTIASLKELGQEIINARYKTEYSSAQWETPEEITGREGEVDDGLARLAQLCAEKRTWLASELAREEKKEELRLKFANLAGDFERYCKDMGERAAAAQFGFDLPEVQAYKATMESEDAATNAAVQERQAAYQGVFDEAAGLGVKENVYTQATPESLAEEAAALQGQLSQRNEAYAKELAKQEANDKLCEEFAALAEPLAAFIKEQKDAITRSQAELEEQLAHVESCIASVPKDKLAAASAAQQKVDAAGITNNRHTLLTAKDLDVQFAQYEDFLVQKKKMLEEAIEHAKLRGITPEQYKEIEENFQQFSSDKSTLNAKQLKACLYSLGEEKGKKEIQALVTQYGGEGADALSYDAYKELMVDKLGDTDTQPEILDGFKLINRGDVCTDERMDVVSMEPHDIEYIKKTAPAVDGGWDYVAWTADVFSR